MLPGTPNKSPRNLNDEGKWWYEESDKKEPVGLHLVRFSASNHLEEADLIEFAYSLSIA